MARILLQIVLPLLLPFAVYAAWVAVRQRQLERSGQAPAPGWSEAPWVWLAAFGVMLALAASLVSLLYGGEERGDYVPPQVGPDGRIIPGHVVPRRP